MKLEDHIGKVLPAVLSEFKISESLESDHFDPVLTSKACADTRVQNIYRLVIQGKSGFTAALDMLKHDFNVLCKNYIDLPQFKEAAECTSASMVSLEKFLEGDLTFQRGFHYVGYVLGSITLAQSISRDLNTGETRPNLVFKALNGVKTRGFKVKQSLIQKCEGIINGRPQK